MFDTFWKLCKPLFLKNQPFSDFRNRAIPKGWKVSGPEPEGQFAAFWKFAKRCSWPPRTRNPIRSTKPSESISNCTFPMCIRDGLPGPTRAAQNQNSDPEPKTARIDPKVYVFHVHSGRPSRTYPGKEFGLGILLDWRAVFAAPALCFSWLRDFGNQANPLCASAPWFGSFLK